MSETEQSSPTHTHTQRREGMVRCVLTGKDIPADEAYWAPPLITAWQLISTVATTLVRSPGNLGHILFEEQDDVPYAQEARDELASRRTAEQLKLLAVLLLIATLIIAPIYLMFQAG